MKKTSATTFQGVKHFDKFCIIFLQYVCAMSIGYSQIITL